MEQRIGHYEILGLLGTGGFGPVYRARDTRVGRTVAVRLMGAPSGNPAGLARVAESVRPVTGVSHPNVATLFDVGEHDGRLYLAYEFVPGDRLNTLTGGRPLNVRRALDICTQVADALADAHSYGLSHGALGPSSIVVTTKGRVKVLDFGLSAWQGAGPAHPVADQPSDLFALGAILYELLTARRPFDTARSSDAKAAPAPHAPPPPSRANSDVPAEVDAIVKRALANNVSDRYATAAELAADLRSAASVVLQREAAAEMAGASPAPSGASRSWRIVSLLLLLCAAVAVGGFTMRDRVAQVWRTLTGPALEPVVVIMPFLVGGEDVSRTYLGPGFSEELARHLARTPGVTVKGRTTIRGLGGRSPIAVAAETRASAVLTGSIAPGLGGWTELDLGLELLDGTTGKRVWSRHYTGPATDAIAILARAARDVAGRLGVADTPSAIQDRALLRLVDTVALDSYLHGHEALAEGDTGRAAILFEEAIAADPSLIEAQAALVEALYLGAVFESRVSYAAIQPRLRQLAEAAAAADPDLATVQLAMGLAAGTLSDAFGHLRRAVELDPSSGSAYLALADMVRDIDPARAIRFARKAADLDPGQPLALYQEAAATMSMGHRADTLATIARGQALSPQAAWWDALRQRVQLAGPRAESMAVAARSVSDFAPGAAVRALESILDGRLDDAANVLGLITRVNPDFCEARALLAGVRRLSGASAEAQRLASEILNAAETAPDQAPWARCAAMAAAGNGDAARAAVWVDRAAAGGQVLRLWGATNAVLSPVPAIRQNLFPWSRVAANTRFTDAVQRLEVALARERAAAARVLEGIN